MPSLEMPPMIQKFFTLFNKILSIGHVNGLSHLLTFYGYMMCWVRFYCWSMKRSSIILFAFTFWLLLCAMYE